MSRFVRRACLFTSAVWLLVVASHCLAQEAQPAATPDLQAAYNQAMMEFQSGNYAKAATELEALVARVEVTPQLEPIFYTIGSAHFNAGDYPKAIAAFKNYQAKFPKGAHAGDANEQEPQV
jgi:outer membrane protein assembly factor BamD (BamD/ComL family)